MRASAFTQALSTQRPSQSHIMRILRGSGSTFSTSGKRWVPWRGNPKIAARNARLHRLKRKGLTPPDGKATARIACTDALAEFTRSGRTMKRGQTRKPE